MPGNTCILHLLTLDVTREHKFVQPPHIRCGANHSQVILTEEITLLHLALGLLLSTFMLHAQDYIILHYVTLDVTRERNFPQPPHVSCGASHSQIILAEALTLLHSGLLSTFMLHA